MKVLVADNDPVHCQLLQTTLSKWGYEVVVVRDGFAAWAILESEEAPSLVLLDWAIAGIDAAHICQQVRQLSRDRYTYILLLSSRGDHSDRVKGLEAGADDFLVKPVDPAELHARLNTGRRILDLQQTLISAREAMRRQATRDALTGLWNHAAILEILDREMARARRDERPAGVVLADLDHFKVVNDTHGHLVGDAVLRQVAEHMLTIMRPGDTLGRYGGEEFLIVLPGCDEAGAVKVCERIRDHISAEPIHVESRTVPVTLSLGATVYEAPFQSDALSLVRNADAALYRAKSAGRNRVERATGP